ncbi:two-component regulator propeller domain-containing protein [Stenotrophomonas sp. GZD-301]|uniref:two-component regulator propeller domain-containing protein n=1 Tax=Stenotrophomonas sp. GZD-301 TaxID=3404814 RepID=UPI003BB4BAFC
MRQGLPSDRVYQIVEDRQGYRWFATSDGLARHDGRRFRLWRIEQGLPDNDITSVALDAQDRLWAGTASGHLLYLSANHRQLRRMDGAGARPVAAGAITTLLALPDGTLWFGTRDAGLYRRSAAGRLQQFLPGPVAAGVPSARVHALARGADGSVWIGTAGGLARWRDGAFLPTPAAAQAVHALSPVGTQMWVGDAGGVQRRGASGAVAVPAAGSAPGLRLLGVGRDGARWLARGARAWREDPHTGVQRVVTLAAPDGRARPRFVGMHEDRDGGVWLLAAQLGVWRLRPDWRAFRAVPGTPGPGTAMPLALASGRDGGAWLAGTDGGLYWIDAATAQRPRRVVRAATARGALGRAVAEDRQGHVWIAAPGRLTRWDPRSGALRRWSIPIQPAGAQRVLRSCGSGHLWHLDGDWLQQRDLQGRLRGRWLRSAVGLPATLDAAAMHCGADGMLWVVQAARVYRWQASRRRLEPVPGIDADAVTALHVDAQDRVWVAGHSAVTAYRWQGGEVIAEARRPLDPRAGPVRALVTDAGGGVWATTARGLLWLGNGEDAARELIPADGLPAAAVRSGQVLRAGTRLLLPLDATGGTVLVDVAALRAPRADPAPVLDRVMVRRHGVLEELPAASPVRLQPGDRDLRVQVRVLTSDGRRREYRMRVAGQPAGWIAVGRPGIREFPLLAPGRHRVLYQARRDGGPWSDTQVLEVEMAPTMLERTDVRAGLTAGGALLALALAGSGVRRRRHRRLQAAAARRQAADERAGQAKADYLATLGHELRTPLTGVLGMSELLLDDRLGPAEHDRMRQIHRAGRQLLQIVDRTLDTARLEAGRLDLHPRTFAPLAVLQRVVNTQVLPLCCRGQALAACLRVGATYVGWGDPERMAQAVALALQVLADGTEARQLLLHADPLPGHAGVRVDIAAHRRGGRRGAAGTWPRRSPTCQALHQALSPARLRVEAMGGRIAVVAAADGWRVVLSLPMAGGLRHRDPAEEDAGGDGRPPVLLVMHDAAAAGRLLAGLRAHGRHGLHAAHALAALSLLSQGPVAALLVERALPGLDGLALLGLVRDRAGDGPAWLLDPAPTPALSRQARTAGAAGVLPLGLGAAAVEAVLRAGPEATP